MKSLATTTVSETFLSTFSQVLNGDFVGGGGRAILITIRTTGFFKVGALRNPVKGEHRDV